MDPDHFDPVPGAMMEVAPGVRRILAPNPSPMTYRGTNTYIVGSGAVAVIDPGPNLAQHHDAILAGLGPDECVTHILVTHSHIDHSPLARALSKTTGAPVYAFGNSQAGRSDVMIDLAATGLTGGGEGVDGDFHPDIEVLDGGTVPFSGGDFKAYWTPGHFCNHLSFAFQDVVFTGDTVMGWASTMVSPPDGDLTQFMTSVSMLAGLDATLFLPGHGAPIQDPKPRCEWLLAHRKSREAEVIDALGHGDDTISKVTARIYAQTPKSLWPAAERNVFAHLIDLHGRSLVEVDPELSVSARFFLRK